MAKRAGSDADQQIGARVRAARMARGMSQERLGEALGITFQQIQKYEKGTNRVAVSTLFKIAAALDVAPADLVPELRGTGDETGLPSITNARALEAARLIANLRHPEHRNIIVGMVRTFCALDVTPLERAQGAQAA